MGKQTRRLEFVNEIIEMMRASALLFFEMHTCCVLSIGLFVSSESQLWLVDAFVFVSVDFMLKKAVASSC